MRYPELGLRERAAQALTVRDEDLAVVISQDPMLGAEFAGFRLRSAIGRGGMGAVYLADSSRHSRPVAVKVMLPELTGNEEFRQRFIREAQSALDHPNIVPVLEAGDVDGVLYIAMEHIDGIDLKALIAREEKLSPARCVAIVEQAADALDHAHENGIVHRDVKPQNVLLKPGEGSGRVDTVYLTDFGLVKRISSQSSFTTSAYLMGTLHYMAPEQIEGKPLDGRTDVYALGCVLFECLTGSVPFDKESEVAVLWSHMNDEPPSAVAREPLLPEAVDVVLARAMAKSPDDRFLTAGEFGSAFALEFGGSQGRVRSVWGPGQISASGKRSRPLQRELAARAAARALPEPPPAAPRTKGFVVGAAAAFVLFSVWFGFGDADRRAAIGEFVDDVAAPFVGSEDDSTSPMSASERDAGTGLGDERSTRRGSEDATPFDRVAGTTSSKEGGGSLAAAGRVPAVPTTDDEPAVPGLASKILLNAAFQTPSNWALYTMNPDGTGVKVLVDTPHDDYDAVWSPDGKYVAFTSGNPGGRLQVVKADGSGLRTLTPDSGWARNPTWSPDGARLAFEYSASADATINMRSGWGIAVVDLADPTVMETLTPLAGSDHDPSWSPDGDRIAFYSFRDDPDGDVFVMDADGSDVLEFAGGPGAQRQPDWSPSGNAIAYSGQRSATSGFELYIKRLPGGSPRRVTRMGRAFAPTFSPNGRHLAFIGGYTEVNQEQPDGLFFMTIAREGGQETRHLETDWWEWTPDWR